MEKYKQMVNTMISEGKKLSEIYEKIEKIEDTGVLSMTQIDFLYNYVKEQSINRHYPE